MWRTLALLFGTVLFAVIVCVIVATVTVGESLIGNCRALSVVQLDAPLLAFDARDAIEYCVAAKAMYCTGGSSVSSWVPPLWSVVQLPNRRGFVMRGWVNAKRVAIVSFRGTQNICDVFADFHSVLVPQQYAGEQVHAGFAASYARVRDAVRALTHDADEVRVTGYSLGGAVATLAASDLAATMPSVKLIAVGTPKVGNAAFRDGFKQRVMHARIIFISGDPVATVPIGLFGRFVHVAEPEVIPDSDCGNWQCNHSLTRYQALSTMIKC